MLGKLERVKSTKGVPFPMFFYNTTAKAGLLQGTWDTIRINSLKFGIVKLVFIVSPRFRISDSHKKIGFLPTIFKALSTLGLVKVQFEIRLVDFFVWAFHVFSRFPSI